jgi:hypothetical protein
MLFRRPSALRFCISCPGGPIILLPTPRYTEASARNNAFVGWKEVKYDIIVRVVASIPFVHCRHIIILATNLLIKLESEESLIIHHPNRFRFANACIQWSTSYDPH